MINRLTLAAIAAAFSLTGCAKLAAIVPAPAPAPAAEAAPDFSKGETLVTVTHIPARVEDGTTVYVTVDGKDAGTLVTGESLALRVAQGQHEVGGYARSLIGRVTIPSVNVTTTEEATQRVAYSVNKSRAEFSTMSPLPTPKPKPAPVAEPSQTVPDAPSAESMQASQTPVTAPAAETAQETPVTQTTEPTPAAEAPANAQQSATSDTAQQAPTVKSTESTESTEASQPPQA